jgi:catechol 2,3-dioxygenase-like lactoylglutathione lyase family enzyme
MFDDGSDGQAMSFRGPRRHSRMQITQAANVVVPVSDIERALAFYTGTLGFEVRQDFTYETGERWLEVVPPGAETALNLARSDEAGIETRVILVTQDLDADRRELEAEGVETSPNLTPGEVVVWGGTPLAGRPPMFFFEDPDGNEFLLVEIPEAISN